VTCDICLDTKIVILPVYGKPEVLESGVGLPRDAGCRTFDCPQCTPMVPYRRVRAMKVATAYEAEQFGRYQAPIERGLAARFGEYLMREGLIRFTTSGSKDTGAMESKITITAHLGVVTREDVVKAGAVAEIALTKPPAIPDKLARQKAERIKRLRLSSRAVPWEPPVLPGTEPDEPITDEFDEPKGALANRFSGLEI
jgi:predicted RNA-binding Zn-ribbon protein involved in translation (DUF1610 family)